MLIINNLRMTPKVASAFYLSYHFSESQIHFFVGNKNNFTYYFHSNPQMKKFLGTGSVSYVKLPGGCPFFSNPG